MNSARTKRGGDGRRIEREARTVEAMVDLYCEAHHSENRMGAVRCADCEALLAYARGRLAKCRYGVDKPACSHCETHCYKPLMKDRIRDVMRWAGPRMVRHHPVLALRHLIDTRRPRRGRLQLVSPKDKIEFDEP